jgi:hypothetical protein
MDSYCIASHIVIALLNIATAIVVALVRSQRRWRKVTVIFLLLPLRASKSDNYRDSWKSDNFRERAIKKSKELIPKRLQRGLRVITLQGAI